jgi:FtsP/CotA-like multicopper oxidase with cupredoxin domain
VKIRFFGLLLSLCAFGWIAGAAPRAVVASSATHAGDCGPHAKPGELVEAPNIDVGQLPLNAGGEHELILAVHRDGERFCYRYTWNGSEQTMAPTIRTMRGEHFAIRIVNDLAGQSPGESVSSAEIPPCMAMHMPPATTTSYVGYLNHTIDDRWMHRSPDDTNIHLHGFEGPPAEENIFLSTLSTPMHACEYHVTIPRRQPPGTYMYHPHAHGSSGVQVASGLDGAWIVEPDEPQIPRSAEHVIMLRYRIPYVALNPYAPDETAFATEAMAHEAALPIGSPVPYDPFNPPPWPVTFPMSAGGVTLDWSGCNGLGSDVRLALNGSEIPALLQVPAGSTQLIRIVNGTSDSATRLLMRDAAGRVQPFHVVGLDGVPVSGDMEHPLARYISMNELMLTSMSRADILIAADAGTSFTLSSEHYCQGADAFFQQHQDLLRISALPRTTGETVTMSSTPAVIADTPAAQLVAYARAHPSLVRRRAFTFTQYIFPKKGKIPPHYGFYITETTNPNFHEHPFWPVYASASNFPSNADVVVKRGAVEEWYLINATMESHAFHIHQMTLVQEKSWAGVPVMTDTVFVPVGSLVRNPRDPNYPLVKPRITKILLDFRHVPRGTFVFHCHMLFHEDRGMMAIIRVV